MIVEADDRAEFTRGLRGLTIRTALAVNRTLRRKGRVWGDRYHLRALRTPREVRACLVYVLQNFRKHLADAFGVDPCSSARWFDGALRDALAKSPADGTRVVRQALAPHGHLKQGRDYVGKGTQGDPYDFIAGLEYFAAFRRLCEQLGLESGRRHLFDTVEGGRHRCGARGRPRPLLSTPKASGLSRVAGGAALRGAGLKTARRSGTNPP